jgi:hypothetical protein
VSARYINEFKQAGYERASLDDWVTLRDHGVSTEFVSELKNLGYDRLPPRRPATNERSRRERLVHQRDQRSWLRELRTIEQLVRLKDHGVSAAYIKRMKSVATAT